MSAERKAKRCAEEKDRKERRRSCGSREPGSVVSERERLGAAGVSHARAWESWKARVEHV
jgi:hypothetical protein